MNLSLLKILYAFPLFVLCVNTAFSNELFATENSFVPGDQIEISKNENGAIARKNHLPDSPDWAGIRRDTAYFMGWQFVAVGVLYVSPEKVSTWNADDKRAIRVEKWERNVTNPEWDRDDWYLNYILHPYWGATYYTRARERGLDRTDSFLVSALWSSLFEYGAESFFEPVSKQDMIVTPLAGALLGEYWFSPLRERIRDKPNGGDAWDKTLMVLTDPFYYLNSWVDDAFGVNSDISVQLVSVTSRTSATLSNNSSPLMNGEKFWKLNFRASW